MDFLDSYWIPIWIRSIFNIVSLLLPPKAYLMASLAATNELMRDEVKPEMTLNEFYVYFGCLEYMKADASGKPQHEYWRPLPDGIFDTSPPSLKRFMPEARFLLIHKLWTWAPAAAGEFADPFVLVRGLIEAFNDHMATLVVPGKYLVIDESMFKWMGRDMPGWSYVPRKPAPGADHSFV